jgi:hypothetical protein
MPNADTIRLLFTYVIALLVLVGCFILLINPPATIDGAVLIPFVTGTTGLVLGFVFNRESTTAGQRSAERAVTLGANTSSPSTTTVNNAENVDAGGPTTVNKAP